MIISMRYVATAPVVIPTIAVVVKYVAIRAIRVVQIQVLIAVIQPTFVVRAIVVILTNAKTAGMAPVRCVEVTPVWCVVVTASIAATHLVCATSVSTANANICVMMKTVNRVTAMATAFTDVVPLNAAGMKRA